MSNASQTSIKVSEETVSYGTKSAGTYYIMGITNSSLRPATTYEQDATIRSSRDIPDLVRLGIGADGELGFALRYDATGALYQLMKATMQSGADAAMSPDITTATASVSNTVNTNLNETGIHTNIDVGDVVRVTDAGTSALVGFFEVLSKTTDNIVVAGGAGMSLSTNLTVARGIRLKNGTTQKSFTVEVGHPDIASGDEYEIYTGMVPDRMRVTIADGQMTQGSFSFVGKKLDSTEATTVAAGTAAPTTQVMNCVDHVPSLRISSTDLEATEVSFEINNSSAARTVIGTLGSKSVRSGSFQVTGTIRAYLSSYTEFEKVVNDTESSLVVACRDSSGKAYAFCFPRIKYSQVETPVTGQDTDVFITLQWQAVYDADADCTMKAILYS